MRKLKLLLKTLLVLFIINLIVSNKNNVIFACTSFTLLVDSTIILGRNLDVENDMGYVFVNQRGVKKTAYFSRQSSEISAEWTSKYGNITFNQISKDIPHGGMNEAELVVEHLYLGESKYELKDQRPALISHQWVQYMLDNCKSVSEIIAISSNIRISDTDYKFPIHFHVMDKSGDRAVIEFLNGKMLVYKDETYKIGVLANSTYENSINQFVTNEDKNEGEPLPTDISNSLERFIKAAKMVEKYNNESPIPYSFSILDAVKNDTQWQIIYDIKNLQIYYRTKSLDEIRILRMSDFSYQDTQTAPINDKEINMNWREYNKTIGAEMINGICKESEFINSILGNEKEEIANYQN